MSLNLCPVHRQPDPRPRNSSTHRRDRPLLGNRNRAEPQITRTRTGEKREEVTFLDLEALGKTADALRASISRKARRRTLPAAQSLKPGTTRRPERKRSKVKFVIDQLTFNGDRKQEWNSFRKL